MTTLPKTVSTPVLRTDFSDQTAWEALLAAIATPNEDGFMAYVEFVEELSSVENNLSISNMDFDDFAAAADEHGVFRGF
jgi:hypothetical protein